MQLEKDEPARGTAPDTTGEGDGSR
jgi:hypothetical protein